MTSEEIKVRQLTNQYLITPADKQTIVHDLCGIQSQFMANALHSLKIRCTDYDESTIKNNLVKNQTIRGTVHIFTSKIGKNTIWTFRKASFSQDLTS